MIPAGRISVEMGYEHAFRGHPPFVSRGTASEFQGYAKIIISKL
jgi:hypothetical protein